MGRFRLLMLLLLVCSAGCDRCDHSNRDLLALAFPHQWKGDIDKIGFNEPSGICWHGVRQTLFVVGDEGDICEIKTDGSLVKQRHLRDADFEGITHDPATGLLYAVVEGDEVILEVDPETFSILREFSIPRQFQGRLLMKEGGEGIEAITFVPDAQHAQGGTFYVANQAFTLTDQEDISALFELELPLHTKGGEPRLIRCVTPGIIDLSGMYHDPHTGHLFVVSDATNVLLEYSRERRLINTFAFPGDNQEGIAVDTQGYLYIAQDTGGILKVKWLRP